MSNRLTELIASLEAIPNIPDDVLSALKKMERKPQLISDEIVASCIWTLAVILPHILDPRHKALKDLCLKLNPSTLYLLPSIRSQLYGDTLSPQLTRPQPKGKL